MIFWVCFTIGIIIFFASLLLLGLYLKGYFPRCSKNCCCKPTCCKPTCCTRTGSGEGNVRVAQPYTSTGISLPPVPCASAYFEVGDKILAWYDKDGDGIWCGATVTTINVPGVSYNIVYDDGDEVSIFGFIACTFFVTLIILLTANRISIWRSHG